MKWSLSFNVLIRDNSSGFVGRTWEFVLDAIDVKLHQKAQSLTTIVWQWQIHRIETKNWGLQKLFLLQDNKGMEFIASQCFRYRKKPIVSESAYIRLEYNWSF